MRATRAGIVLLAATAYVIVGRGTAILAGPGSSAATVKTSRLAAWALSLLIFGVHLLIERRRHGRDARPAAHVAYGVALGALGVAILGPLRAHWDDPSRVKLVALSIVAWPLVAGIPAFVTAYVVGVILDRIGRRTPTPTGTP